MTVTVYVPRDAAALAVGADDVAAAVEREAAARGLPVRLVRNGSRGMLWLEPLVEVATPSGRVAYGPVSAADAADLFDAGFLTGSAIHPLSLGPTEEIPYLKNQERVTFARCGVIDPLSLEDYRAHGGFVGFDKARGLSGAEIIGQVTESGLRGRGGAGFPAGIKWKTVAEAAADEKFIVCNADEGDGGGFADRLLMEGDPFRLIEGMMIAGLAVGAAQAYVYLRSEYPHAATTLGGAVRIAYGAGLLGENAFGENRPFDVEIRIGAGAYVCGEETALLESIEGKRGVVRAKPPLPALQGLWGKPTVVNNVLTLAAVPDILVRGPEFYAALGVGRSRGTQPFQLSGDLRRGGLVEKAFGVSLRELLYDFAGGSASGRPIRAAQVGGPLGAYLAPAHFDMATDYETYASVGAVLGHGGIVAFNDATDMADQARFAFHFCAQESCGKCTPCRIGSTRGVEIMDRILAGQGGAGDVALLRDLCEVMRDGSLCALGGMTPYPVLSALDLFEGDFNRR
jgi:formate dehydrogenase iron-sulfur subunit